MFDRCLTIITIVLFSALLPAPVLSGATEPLTPLQEIRTAGGGSESTVEIIASGPVTFSSSVMPQLLRVTIDLPLTTPGIVKELIPVNSGMVAKVTVQKKSIDDTPLTRVVIHLHQSAEYTARQEGNDRVVVTLRKAPAGSRAATGVPAAQPAPPSGAPPSAITPPVANRPVVVTAVSVTTTGIEIRADRAITEFHAFTLTDPGRLVIDLPQATTGITTVKFPDNPWGILSARSGSHPGKIRLVFDRKTLPFPAYEIRKTARGLAIDLPILSPGRPGRSR